MEKVFERYINKTTGETIMAVPVFRRTVTDIFYELFVKFRMDNNVCGINSITIHPTGDDGKKYELVIPFNPTVYLAYNLDTKKFFTIAPIMLCDYKKVAEIKIKYFTDEIEKLRYIDGKSDWIDLRAAEEVELKAGDFKLIPLGVAMQLPDGYEAHVVPRSSTFKNYGIIEANSMGIIDEKYCGDNDQWFFPALAFRDTIIRVNDRICQFRIEKHQPPVVFDEVIELGNPDRGGHGSTGKQ